MRPRHCDAFNIKHGMEQTSMTNAIKKRLNRKGFTLAEVLVTVAIILILAGVTFVSVVQYQKNLRLMEMDGTAKEIFIAAQNHLSVAQASGDLDRLAEKAKSATGTTDSTIGTKLSSAPSYAGSASGEYYYVIHDVKNGIESYTPSGSDAILQMMLPFGALDETVATSGNYAIVYELKSASVVAVLYSGAGNASFGNAAVINFGDDDVSNINKICNDKSARKNYVKNGVTAIVGCYTGKAGSAAIPTETLEAPKLEVKNENKLHVLVREAKNIDNITLVITGEQSGTTARRLLNQNAEDGYTKTSGTFDVTLDDITGDGKYRFSQLINEGRFKPDVAGSDFIPGENIIISAIASSTSALATPKESAKYTVSSLFDDVNETTNSAGDTKIYIKNLRHLENLGANVSGFTAALGKDTTSGHYNVVNITAVQKNDITMLSFDRLHDGQHIYGSGTFVKTYIAANVDYPLSYDGGSHEIYDLTIAGYHANGAEANAGIFGTVTSALSVKNLVLRNDKMPKTSTSANAGMLLGKTSANLTVDGVLAYYHEESYNADNDSNVEVVATADKGVAGGLIGFVSGGMLNVKNSAAAVYVKGGSAAGGLIGSVIGAETGSTIVQSYAGGHTKDGAYSTTDAADQPVLTGAGRYNVQATQASGYAGGFIGESSDKVIMNAVYSTASAYSKDAAKSGSFSGTTNVKFATGNNYYAIGPHNGTDASADDTAKAEITTGQVRRQATPYDRKLILKGTETEHQKMDKTSYPLCTVRNLCEGDASVKDTDLPWFIKEHVGDWVVSKKTEESNFEVENGNRLTVRINTGLNQITEDLYYEVKVHGETRGNYAYFLLHIKPDSTVDVQRKYNNDKFEPYNYNIATVRQDTTPKKVELYLDDITNRYGNFASVCSGNYFYPGEDISINVTPLTSNKDTDAVYDEDKKLYTNSLYGYLQNESVDSSAHNKQKIKAVQEYVTTAGTEKTGLGLIKKGDQYYVQIDNSRHLENLSKHIGYPWQTEIGQKIAGAIQTDNIYWSGSSESNAYTKGFQEELGTNLSVFSKDAQLTNNGYYCPIINTNLKLYDGSGFRISGVNALEQAQDAALFAQIESDVTIKNLTLEKSTFKSETKRAAGLIAYAGKKVNLDKVYATVSLDVTGSDVAAGLVAHAANSITITNSGITNGNIRSTNGGAAGLVSYAGQSVTIDNVNCTGGLNINGKNEVAGFVAHSANSITINNSSIENENINSTNNWAGGLIAYAGQAVTISYVECTENLNVKGYSETGGFVGRAENIITITNSGIEKGTINSSDSNAGGLIGYTGAESTLSNITFGNKNPNKEDLNGEFYVQSNGKNRQNASAGGLVARAGGIPTISNVHFNVNLTVENTNNSIPNADEEAVGGLIGFANAKVYIKDTSIKNGTVKSIETRAGGFIGAANNEVEIKNSKINCGIISSDTDRAGGLLAFAKQVATVDGVNCNSLIVTGKSTSGGFLGFSQQKVTIQNSELNNCTVLSTNDHAGGLIAQGSNVTISNVNITGNISVTAKMAAGGFVGYNTDNTISVLNSSIHSAVVSSAETYSGGFIGYTNAPATISGAGLISDSLITSETSDAGGVIGHAKSGVNITNTKVIGSNTEIIAKSGNSNAGGLIGGFESRLLMINNSAASVFVRAESGNAGGLIGFINGLTYGSKIENSYYGGRTIKGIYGGVTVHKGDSANERTYAANIIAGSAAGGLIGAIEGKNWQQQFNISQCYSSGSVQTKTGPAGGFIGNANLNGGICLSINQCYSIGPVLKSDDKTGPIRGGFIGLISTSTTNDIGFAYAYYLSSFNADVLNAIGSSYGSVPATVQVINSPELITGQDASVNLTANSATYVFDETLKGKEPYPYQNWTTENGTITYYGDWPVPQINGMLVYYHRDYGNKQKGICTLVSSETSFQSLLTAQSGEVEKYGFGIILDSIPQDWGSVSELYIWSNNQEGPFVVGDRDHQMRVTEKYSTFDYGGKTYIFARITNDKLRLKHFFVKNMITEDVYEVTYDENTAEVKVVSEKNG